MDLEKLTKIEIGLINKNTIIHYPDVHYFCWRPYPDHPNGCPSIQKCKKQMVPSFESWLEFGHSRYYYLIYAIFSFKKYKEQRKKEHSNWSDKQLGNPRHWQNSIKKMISDSINQLPLQKGDYVFGCGSGLKLNFQKEVGSMENACINVFSTMKLNGIKLEIKPVNQIYLVCLVCTKHFLKLNSLDKWIKKES